MSHVAWSSMTCFAQVEKEHDGVHYKLQAKSVNHRFFDLKLRASREWQVIENDINSWMKKNLQRGHVDLWIENTKDFSSGGEGIDLSRINRYMKNLQRAYKESENFQLGAPFIGNILKASALIVNRDLLQQDEGKSSNSGESLKKEILKEWFHELSEKMREARLNEGSETQKNIKDIHSDLSACLEILQRETPKLLDEWKSNMEERIQNLAEKFEKETPDSTRIYQEFVMLADKKDVSEELQRIDAHLKALETLLTANQEKAVGKKLDFLAQELNREFTTLNNKTQDPQLSETIASGKLSIEKIREQALNLV